MLVLTRKTDEKIIIGPEQNITITILRIQGDKVSVGIEADKNLFPVFRKELLEPKNEVRMHLKAKSNQENSINQCCEE